MIFFGERHIRHAVSGAYHVIALDREGYSYAMVTSSSRSYLWILARQKRLDPAVQTDIVAKAKAWGFRTDDLIFVEQEGDRQATRTGQEH